MGIPSMQQLDLALFLRLSRSLERTRSTGCGAPDGHAAILRAIDGMLLSMEERSEWLRTRQAAQPLEAAEVEEAVDIHVDAVAPPVPAVPPVPTLETEAAVPALLPEAVSTPWSRQHDLLYEDVLCLFKLGDNEGAFVSLGRLLQVAYETPELKRFVDINRKKLLTLYEKTFGSFSVEYTLSVDSLGDRYFWSNDDAEIVFGLLKECNQVKDVYERSPLPKLLTLALIHRRIVERVITFPGQDSQALVS